MDKNEQLSIQRIKKRHPKPCFDMCSALVGLPSNIPRDLRLVINDRMDNFFDGGSLAFDQQ
jgi:hypothetical protein